MAGNMVCLLGRESSLIALSVTIFFLFWFLGNGVAQADWEKEWQDIVQAAEKEGKLVVYGSAFYGEIFGEFQKKYPKITVNALSGSGSAHGQRIMTERRAGRFLVDLFIDGIVTPNTMFYRAKILEPIPPILMLPEVLDKSKWWKGKHHYADPEEKYIFTFEGTVHGGENAYNTKLIDPEQFKSYWDFLDPKWRGKIVAYDPNQVSTVAHSLRFFFNNPALGPEFVRRFLGEADLRFSRDMRQMVDWLAVGKFPIAFFISGVEEAAQQALPVKMFEPGSFKEGAFVGPTAGAVAFLNRAPHPSAAKVAINWLLSREGQSAFQTNRAQAGSYAESMREDISKEVIPFAYRRVKGARYIYAGRPEWIMGRDELSKVLNQALGKTR